MHFSILDSMSFFNSPFPTLGDPNVTSSNPNSLSLQ